MSKVFQIVVGKASARDGVADYNNNNKTHDTKIFGQECSLRLLNIDYYSGDLAHDYILRIESDQLLSPYGSRYFNFLHRRIGGTILANSTGPTFKLPVDGKINLNIVQGNGAEPTNFECILTFAVDF